MRFHSFVVLNAAVGISLTLAIALPTPAPLTARNHEIEKRLPSDGSALLGNPSSALEELSILLQDPSISSQFQSIATQSAYKSQLSSQYDREFGTASASQLVQSYEGLISSILSGGGDDDSGAYTAFTTQRSTNKDNGNLQGYQNSANHLILTSKMAGPFIVGVALLMVFV